MSAEASAQSPQTESLRANAIGLPGVLFQSITTMAPASAVAFSLVAAIPFTGGALPLAAIIALIVCVLVALNIGSMARHLPSAGGYYTYVSRGLGAQAGWMTGWLFSLAYLLIVPFQLLVLGPVADQFVNQYFHLSFGTNGWIVWAAVFAVIIFLLTYFGIRISADTGVVLGCIEIGVFVLLSLWLIFSPGSQNTGAAFNPSSSSEGGLGGWQGVFVGMLFVFTAFAGFEIVGSPGRRIAQSSQDGATGGSTGHDPDWPFLHPLLLCGCSGLGHRKTQQLSHQSQSLGYDGRTRLGRFLVHRHPDHP